MDYFNRLLQLLKLEKEADRKWYEQLTKNLSTTDRREAGLTWYPVAIKDTELGRGDYLTVEVERTTHQDLQHNLRFGMTAALFSNYNAATDRVEGTITHISGNRLKLALRTDELPEWSRGGKLGIDAVFDEAAYKEMEIALQKATALSPKDAHLTEVLTGSKKPSFNTRRNIPSTALNTSQQSAVEKIIAANELAIVHGPPGTGKTTTLVQAIKALIQEKGAQILATAPSNAAVDLLSEKLAAQGLNVVRVGNPARVSEGQLALALDSKAAAHHQWKEIRRLRKQAAAYRDMAQQYKRRFGPAEKEQRKALFAEARAIAKEIEATEQYIYEDVLDKAQVITATLVGAAHYTVRQRSYETVVIDEAAQAVEPACWIPILKARKLIMAGDHHQLPPTIKCAEAATKGLSKTLMEKCVELHPESVVMLEEQYRMHEAIMAFPAQEFYSGKLKANIAVADQLLFPADEPLLFIDTAGCGFEEVVQGTSISNEEEAQFLVKHLSQLVEALKQHYKDDNFPAIAVIAPYRHQVEILKEAVAAVPEMAQRPSITVNTIDSFQGQERDVVYISLTRSNADSSIGFLSEVRRMNVAMTRARKKLVVIGDSSTLSQHSFYADFIAYAQANDGYRSAWEFM